MDQFSVSYDRTTKIVTALACMLLVIPPAALHTIAFRLVGIITVVVGCISSGISSYTF